MTDHDTTDSPLRVRPYLLTGGRTRSSVELAIEAQIRLTPKGQASIESASMERRTILELCVDPQSVAEISAHCKIHLQVARVLVGDLITEDLLHVQEIASHSPDRPDLDLLNRVLDGLQAL